MSPDLSIIVPFFNEDESIRPLYGTIVAALESVQLEFEILLIDDGSVDKTFQIAAEIAAEDDRVKVIKFRKNYGQTPAMGAGIDMAIGRVLVTMDGDLQNDPADIPLLLEKIEEGYDIVVGWRYRRQDKLFSRKIPSRIANWLIGKVTGVPIKDNGCSLKAYRADVIKSVPLYSEMHRFIPAMASISGARIAEVKVNHKARQFGESKYGLSRIYKVLIDLLTIKTLIAFASRPFRWFAYLSVPFLVLSSLLLGTSILQVMSFSSTFSVAIAGTGVLFGALAMFLLGAGILGELVYFSGDLSVEKLHKSTAEYRLQHNQPHHGTGRKYISVGTTDGG